ncbi:hypothetical protein E3N88_09015 [Mikania micrantha]|uniref:DUF4218 domain-containing protein n=1 Tax=Mikania micrantha TaxID=192012 RepID=A0A5N6PHV0_9ASTR|nr:hypothetical protein E3N88_09015 [Mikania micrantha]
MHGESLSNRNLSSINAQNDAFQINDSNIVDDDDHSIDLNDNLSEMLHDLETNIGDDDQRKLHDLFDDAKKPLYPGCEKFSKLNVVLKLFNLKSNYGWSDKSFTDLLVILHDMLPDGNELPISTKEFEKEHKCVICGASRYKRKKETDDMDDDVTKNGPPNKILLYFPIIPRLKRLFSNENEAKLLRWHKDGRVNDGKLRHVADSPQWRNIDHKYPDFGEEVRNIRFGLSSDGINPFVNVSSRHSTWPVLLCIYNLPPWLCMKRKYIMMTLLIQGPKQPGNDIDVYLAPLIDDLKTLWGSGIVVYDAYNKENFTLRAMIFCTISDFPAYGNLSGYSTKGKKACPVCEDETNSIWLKNFKKTVYMGYRRFLPTSHVYRNKKDEFDGNTEHRTMRKRFDAFSRVENLNIVLGKRTRAQKDAIWKKNQSFGIYHIGSIWMLDIV